MATFNNCTHASTVLEGTRKYLSFNRSAGQWVYCNYPERLPSDGSALGDSDKGNRYLNQVPVNGPAQVFASYVNDMAYPIYFGVQLYNAGTVAVTATLENNAHRHSGTYTDWCDVEGGVWVDFFANNPGTQFTVNPGRSAWIFEGAVPAGKFFNSLVRFRTTGPLWCFPYVYTSRAKINGTATCYPWVSGQRVYRGEGDSYFLATSLNLNVSELPVHWLSHHCSDGNQNEMIAIRDRCANQDRSCSNTDNNLGNWGAQYLYTVALTNDTSLSKTIRLFAGAATGWPSDPTGFEAIVFNGIVKYCCCPVGQWWNFITDTLPSGATATYQFQHIHAANGTSPLALAVKAI